MATQSVVQPVSPSNAGGISIASFQNLNQHDLEAMLAEQLQALQRAMLENQRASFIAGAQSRSIRTMEVELAELQHENILLRTQLAKAGVAPQITGANLAINGPQAFKSGETGSTMEVVHPISKGVSLPGSIADETEEAVQPVSPGSGSSRFGRNYATVPAPSRSPPPLELAPVVPVATDLSSSLKMADAVAHSHNNEANFGAPTDHAAAHRQQASLMIAHVSTFHERSHTERSSVANAAQMSETMTFLRKIPAFKKLPPDAFPSLAQATLTCDFPLGSVLMKQGDHDCNGLFIIVHGTVGVTIDGKKVNHLSVGEYVGENALLHSTPRNATIIAETQVTVLKLSQEKFQDLGLKDVVVFAARLETGEKPRAVFADAAAMKEKLRVAMAKPPYDVRNFYKDTGVAQKIARHNYFENVTLAVIAFNALWIAVDTDYNDADVLLDARIEFIIMENFFCIFFTGELMIRYISFRHKYNCLKDAWFVFDSVLVFMMVAEQWVANGVMLIVMGGSGGGSLGNASILRLFRLLRLSRMARMARLLRAMPELMVLIKGMSVAMRSVFFTLCLLAGIIYVFAIAFVQLLRDTDAEERYFPNVGTAMNALLLDGVLPDQADIINGVAAEGWIFRISIMLYILFASMTVMNMLVGVLCEVVSVVSSVERESLLVNYVKSTLLHMLKYSGLDADGDHQINKTEFQNLLENDGARKALMDVGVDPISLIDFTDFIFPEGKEQRLSFPDFMDMVLQLRGTNTATVKDVVDLRKFLVSEFQNFQRETLEKTSKVFSDIMVALESSLTQQQHSRQASPVPSPSPPPQLPATLHPPSSFGNLASWPNVATYAPTDNAMLMSASRMSSPHCQTPEATVTELTGLSWATAAASRLSAAAGELSAAAGQLSNRNRRRLDHSTAE